MALDRTQARRRNEAIADARSKPSPTTEQTQRAGPRNKAMPCDETNPSWQQHPRCWQDRGDFVNLDGPLGERGSPLDRSPRFGNSRNPDGDHAIRQGRTAPEAPPLPVRRDRQEEESGDRGGPRRDQPRRRRPRQADPEPRSSRASRKTSRIPASTSTPSTRGPPSSARASPRSARSGTARPRPQLRDPPADRLEGRDRPLPPRRAQPRRHQPRPRPVLSRLPEQQPLRRRRRLHDAARTLDRLPARPRRHPGRRLQPGPAAVPQLPQQPHRRDRRPPLLREGGRSGPEPTTW